MNKLIKNRKGMTLVTVIIIMTVLVLLCAMLAEAVMQTLVITKRHRNIDFAYYAGESAIEKWASILDKQIVNKPNLGDSYSGSINLSEPSSRELYANYIIANKIDVDEFRTQNIDVEGKTSNEAQIDFEGIEYVDTDWDSAIMGSNSMDILIGFKANAAYSSTGAYNTGNKRVYAVKKFRVSCPVRNELESAIYAVGDFYINGQQRGDVVKVKGDVFTFGSYAAEVNSPNQSYFGGIYAINGGLINIYGNAYSRSFIRTGPYKSDPDYITPDSSRIVVFKDAIAECIQSFGNNNVTAVLGNAYTFDDIEINGQNSVIAVNGSFFGLSKGGSIRNHDQSSAVVNSAMIHQFLAPGSLNSRIAINGDVFIPGSTLKINTDTNMAIGPIEDASVAYNNLENMPHYKWWPGNWDNYAENYKYHENLRANEPNVKGFFNQFQIHDMLYPFKASFDEVNEIDNWIDDIKNKNDTNGNPAPMYMKGISSYEIAANGKLYQNSLNLDTVVEFDSNFKVKESTNNATPVGKYRLDNIFENGFIKYDEKHWDGITTFEELYGHINDYGFAGKCGEIHSDLLNKVHKFATRENTGSSWVIGNRIGEFDKILKTLQIKSGATTDILHIDRTFIDDEYNLNDLFISEKSIDVYARSSVSRASGFDSDTDYFIFSNADKNVNIRINGAFNGIIVTAGKIVLEDGASVYGSIIVAGDGEYDGDTFYPKAEDINGSKKTNLDDGVYAAISAVADYDTSTSPPYVDFFLGLTGGYTDPVKEDGMIAVINKAVGTTAGSSLIPSTVTATEDRLVYLNKAARINLLEKFAKKSIYLYDIF